MSVAERVAPAIGAYAAERMWFRVPSRPSARRLVLPAGGDGFEVVAAGGGVIRGRRWGAGPVVYLVHGWGGWAAQLAEYVAPLVDRGFTVVAFDAPSHGLSDPGPSGPRQTDALEFGRAFDAVSAVHGPAHTVIAHSMGAMTTLLTIEYGWLGAQRLVFLAPMPTLDSALDTFGRWVNWGPRIRHRLEQRIARRVGTPVEAFDVGRLAAGLREETPLLVVHDRRDRDTPYSGSESIVGGWPGAQLVGTTGLGHSRLLRDAEVVRTVTRFVSEPTRIAETA